MMVRAILLLLTTAGLEIPVHRQQNTLMPRPDRVLQQPDGPKPGVAAGPRPPFLSGCAGCWMGFISTGAAFTAMEQPPMVLLLTTMPRYAFGQIR